MQLILMVVEGIGLVVGSLALAVLLCWFLWYAFRLVRHPEWGASFVLMLLLLAVAGELPKSQFLDMTLTFAMFVAVPLWIAGRAWRDERRHPLKKPSGQLAELGLSKGTGPIKCATLPPPYPAITACIGEARSPTREEVRLVASRLWREGLAHRLGSQAEPANFAVRRALVRAAKAALSGWGVESTPMRGVVKL
ncbi:hypothetical protein KZX46_00040 (plasmid) [Polymorphobacter sp. PAMC 29334]|uniref:hypothetical protein n=1 Tax=Polymorphobacter sp. PAMC 29334 TaxID=2862331 RepID=UPI001C7425CE|nr:hypothetical protein [Polymorphobacter sp. PAMC 29334]QYE33250.1 hypothetical protein KZX46_00040 [Polymorphobacter sp. PAMC 29334]